MASFKVWVFPQRLKGHPVLQSAILGMMARSAEMSLDDCPDILSAFPVTVGFLLQIQWTEFPPVEVSTQNPLLTEKIPSYFEISDIIPSLASRLGYLLY